MKDDEIKELFAKLKSRQTIEETERLARRDAGKGAVKARTKSVESNAGSYWRSAMIYGPIALGSSGLAYFSVTSFSSQLLAAPELAGWLGNLLF